jgi:hypothetical protein
MINSLHAGLLAGLALLVSGAAQGHLPELFGRDYLRVADTPAQSTAPAPAPDGEEELEKLEKELESLRGSTGAYDASLADPLLQLARLQATGRNPVAAIRYLEEALHLLRVNNGLLHPVQLPLLRLLSEVYLRIGDVTSALAASRYAYRVHGMGLEPLDETGLADSLRYFRQARDCFIDPVLRADEKLFLQAYDDNELLYDRMLANPDADYATLRSLGISHLHNLYVLLGTDVAHLGGISMGAGSPGRERMVTLQTLGFGRGLRILNELLLRAPAAPTRNHLLLERANWLQWNGKWQRARDDYIVLMAQLPAEDATLRSRLASPAVLPEDPALWERQLAAHIPVRAEALASYDVSERGDVSGVELQPLDNAPPARAGRLRRMLLDSHLRPALSDTGPIDGSVTARRYRLID